MLLDTAPDKFLAAHVSCHFFADDSGVVLFNQRTGETLGLALCYQAFMDLCLSKSYPEALGRDVVQQLESMLAITLKKSERSDDTHLNT